MIGLTINTQPPLVHFVTQEGFYFFRFPKMADLSNDGLFFRFPKMADLSNDGLFFRFPKMADQSSDRLFFRFPKMADQSSDRLFFRFAKMVVPQKVGSSKSRFLKTGSYTKY
jgi:hypothetical protein